MSAWFDDMRRARQKNAALKAMQDFADTHDGCSVHDDCVLVPVELADECKSHVETAIEKVRKEFNQGESQ